MVYLIFLSVAFAYNWRKFKRERDVFLSSLKECKNDSHVQMILSHHFHVFILEAFLALIVAHAFTDKSETFSLLGLIGLYLGLLVVGFFCYQYFLKFLEQKTQLILRQTFNQHLIKEFRVSFALIFLPLALYSTFNWTFQDSSEWGNYWPVGVVANTLFVSVLTIICTVIIMLKLLPNREITEPEYLDVINARLKQIGVPGLRVRWIETDIKNAFVVGLKLLRFSNQTMFVGRSLRTYLTMEEFDAVIAHELAHVANRHVHKRVIELMKNFLFTFFGILFLTVLVLGLPVLVYGEDAVLHDGSTTFMFIGTSLVWIIFNYALFFDTIRSHEFEADAYAVMVLGADRFAFKSALEKLTTVEEMPEYLISKTKKKHTPHPAMKWVTGRFRSHPSIEERIDSLNHKILHGLPYNDYVSPARKARLFLGRVMNWRVSIPLTTATLALLVWTGLKVSEGSRLITLIEKSSSGEIMQNSQIIENINSRPKLIGESLMYHIVRKKDPELIDYFLKNGANKGKALVYIGQLKDFDLFARYYRTYESTLSDDEYFLILRKTALVEFTEGYRYLVNSRRFETLNSEYKEDIALLHKTKSRKPASVK